MSRKKKSQEAEAPEPTEGWEGLAEEESVGAIAPSPDLEEALREAADAIESTAKAPTTPKAAPGGEDDAELAETKGRLLRLQADFENFRRRALRERQDALNYGHENLVKNLLATVDNLDRAIDHVRKSEGGDLESLLQGVELVQRELLTALGQHGVVRIEALGEPFDPANHEAMAHVPDDSVPANTVTEELQTGYRLRDRLLRPARVIVSKPPDDGGEG